MNVFIVDDHQLFRMGTRLALNGKMGIEIAGEAASGKELFAALEKQTPDIILLDIMLPDMSGVEIARKLKQEKPEIKVLMLSAEDPKTVIEEILEIGVEGYISKASPMEEVEYAIASVMNDLEYFGRDISKIIYEVITSKKKQTAEQPSFTPRELEIIQLCCDGFLSKEIAFRLEISYRTVENHKNNIFRKLGINNRVELAKYAIKYQLI